MDGSIRVLFLDDEPRLRECWQKLVCAQSDMELVGCLPSADEIPARVPHEDTVVVMDLSMPGRNPLEAASEIRDAHPNARVILYTGYFDPETLRLALACGAWGLVDKLTPILDVLAVIRRVAAGETAFPEFIG